MPEQLTNNGLVEHAQQMLALPTAYMWGTLARKIDQSTIDWCKKTYPNMYDPQRVAYLKSQIGIRYGCDCVGLMKSYYFGGLGSPKYTPARDYNTNAIYAAATQKGPLPALPEVPGTCLYMKGHVGIYTGEGGAIECTLGSHGDGVVISKVQGRGWTDWFYCPFLTYPNTPPTLPNPPSMEQPGASPTFRKGDVVMVRKGAKTFIGGTLAAYVYDLEYQVLEVSGERVVIGKGKTPTAAIRKSDLIKSSDTK